jgi:hypothetical protein
MFKQKHKQSRAEVLKAIENQQEVNRQRVLIKEQIVPLVIEITKNVKDSKIFLATIVQGLRQAFQNKAQTFTVEEIGLVKFLEVKNERYEEYKRLLEVIKDEKLVVGISLLEGLSNLIDGCIQEEMNKKGLSELDLKLLDPYEVKK